MNLKDFMEVIDYKITEGSVYQWSCFGNNAYSLDSWNGDQEGHTVTALFDTKDQTIYQMMAYDYIANRAYRWMNPEFVSAYKAECASRNSNDEAWEDVEYTDLEVEEDFLEKARGIVTGAEYDTRIQIPLDFDKETTFQLMQLAHEADLTLNKYVEKILRDMLGV